MSGIFPFIYPCLGFWVYRREASPKAILLTPLLVIYEETNMENELIKIGFDEDTIMCQDCKDAVASHRGRHYDTELCYDCFSERYD